MLQDLKMFWSGRGVVRRGFTVAETILVVVVLAILVGLSFPAVTRYMTQRDVQLEQNRMMEIRNGLKAYLADHNEAPPVGSWYTALAGGYVNLTPSQTQLDVWGRPRVLRAYTDNTRNVMGNSVPVVYMSLHSRGMDGKVTATPGVGTSGTNYNVSSHVGWWNNPALSVPDVISGYSNLRSESDDLLMKITDYTEKLSNYELTVQRIDRIVAALETHARNLYSKEVARCAALTPVNGLTGDALCDTPGALEAMNYFPRARPVTADETTPLSQWNYYDTSIVVRNNQSVALRRTDMQNLMRILGLPVDYCCSAITMASDGPMPFYYFSNPRQRNSDNTCRARPTDAAQRLSPRVVTTNVPDGSTDATCG